jgi:hypothetical protein
MAKNEIDPRFFLPPGVVDLEYSDQQKASSDTPVQEGDDDEQLVEPTEFSVAPEDYANTNENALYPPDTITLVSQTVKNVAGGGYLVDVIIDVPGNSTDQFEVRLTK